MFHLNVFCPFERVTSLYVQMARDSGARYIELTIEGYHGRRIDISKSKGVDFAMGYTVPERKAFLRSDQLAGKILILDDTQKVLYEKKLVIYNDLVTDGPLAEDWTNANDCLGNLVGYPEAYTSTPGISFETDQKWQYDFAPHTRPFFSYVIFSRGATVDEIHGPSNKVPGFVIDGVCTLENKDQISFGRVSEDRLAYVDSPLVIEEEKKELQELTSNYQALDFAVILKCGESTTNFVFGQSSLLFDGQPLRPETLQKILYITLFTELCAAGRLPKPHELDTYFDGTRLTIPLVKDPYYVISTEMDAFYRQFIFDSDQPSAIMQRLIISKDKICIKYDEDTKLAFFIGPKSSACFAFSFAYLLASKVRLSTVYDLMQIVFSFIDKGILDVADGVLTGKGSATPAISIVVDSTCGPTKVSAKRINIDKPSDLVDGEVYVIGFDRPDGKKDGACDHYVVAQYLKEHFFVIYDPYRLRPYPYGTDVTSLFSIGDHAVISLKGSFERNGEVEEFV